MIVTVGAVAICAVLGAAVVRCDLGRGAAPAAGVVSGVAKEPASPAAVSQSSRGPGGGAAPSQSAGPGYWLRSSGGRIGVFVEGESEPQLVLDVYVGTLPEADRRALEEGIFVPDYQTLLSLVEDYVS